MNDVDAALYSKLTADATLMAMIPGGVHKLQAPVGVAAPLIIFHREEATHTYATGGTKAFINLSYIIKAVAEGFSTVACHDILDRVEAVLATGVTVTGHTVLVLRRRSDPAEYVEDADGGKTYMHVASAYDVALQ